MLRGWGCLNRQETPPSAGGEAWMRRMSWEGGWPEGEALGLNEGPRSLAEGGGGRRGCRGGECT